ncbi:MAG TPA: DinB family protein [Ktedonobacterales bacterium]|jgi:predicted RNase H-like HicB family nuclease
MDFYALIEEWSDPDESIVFFRELPGCFVSAATTQEAIQQAPEAIADYARWLKQNQLCFLEGAVSLRNVVVKEILRANPAGPRFESDLPAPTDQEMETALQVAAIARALLAHLYNVVVPAQRNCAPKPGEWSLTDHLEHILKAEAHYVGCLSEQAPEALLPVPEEELSLRLIENGRTYETVLRGLTPFQRARIYIQGEAEWTAAKTLRRMTKHLREHYPWMQEVASQVAPNSHLS